MICNIILPTEYFPYAEDTEVCVLEVKTQHISPKDFRQVIRNNYSHSKFQILHGVIHTEISSTGGRN